MGPFLFFIFMYYIILLFFILSIRSSCTQLPLSTVWWNNWPSLSSQTVAMVTIMRTGAKVFLHIIGCTKKKNKVCIYCVQMLINKKILKSCFCVIQLFVCVCAHVVCVSVEVCFAFDFVCLCTCPMYLSMYTIENLSK